MEVLVASQNSIKAASAHEAFTRFLGEAVTVTLAEHPIDSGVSDQPMSLEESAEGARNRIDAIRSRDGFDYYVSIEGGVFRVAGPEQDLWFESACAAVLRADDEHPVVAFGPAFPVPERFIKHLLAGHDLNYAMERETGMVEAGKGQGFNGWLTNNQINRQQASAEAVLLALHGLRHL